MTSKRVTLVADELLGYVRTGGIGTATSFLGIALARMGHPVDVLYLGPPAPAAASSEWLRMFADAGVSIRQLPRSHDRVEPPYFGQMRDVQVALASDPPDVVVVQDLAAPAYVALRLRQLGLAFEQTLFVVLCHGTRRWITDTARKVRVLPNAHAVTLLEQASIELADAIVSPSRYLVDWMHEQGWQLPKTHVIPWFTRWAATGESPPLPRAVSNGPVQRISFFGRLEERKGIRVFLEALNELEPALLQGRELEFLGRATPAWTPERIEGSLSDDVRAALRRISIETELDQHDVLARLEQPGTLAVLPSFGETFGNAVRECLDHGIPFVASNVGAVPELIAPPDQDRVLFPPTPAGIGEALRRAFTRQDALTPARAALDDETSFSAWDDVIGTQSPHRPLKRYDPHVDVVILSGSAGGLTSCLSALAEQTYRNFSPIVVTPADARVGVSPRSLPMSPLVVVADEASLAAMRAAGARAGRSGWLLFLDAGDAPEPALLESLVRAQAASGADVVSCGLLLPREASSPTVHLFLGDPGGLGTIANGYGTVALIRRSLLEDTDFGSIEGDQDWPLLAGLALSGARIVSVPIPLVRTRSRPADVRSDPLAALRVVQHFESALPKRLASLARLAAGLGAEAARARDAAPERRLARVRRRIARPRS